MVSLLELVVFASAIIFVACGLMTAGTNSARAAAQSSGEVDYPFKWTRFFATEARVRRKTLRSTMLRFKPKLPFYKVIVGLVIVYVFVWIVLDAYDAFIAPLYTDVWSVLIKLIIVLPLLVIIAVFNTTQFHQPRTVQVWVGPIGPQYARDFVPGQYTDVVSMATVDPDTSADIQPRDVHVEYVYAGALNGPVTLTHPDTLLVLGANIIGDDRASRQAGTLVGKKYDVECEVLPKVYIAGDVKYQRMVDWVDRASKTIPNFKASPFITVIVCLDTKGNGHAHVEGETTTLQRELFESRARVLQLQQKYGSHVRIDAAVRPFEGGGAGG